MVNLDFLLKKRNCPTLEHQLIEDIEMSMEYEEQKYGEFPPHDSLYEREDDPNVYKENPILKSLFEHYQPFFEKGINYNSDGKTWNVYPSGSMLLYCNEAFSLCTKLSIDPYPEQYFIDEYYRKIGGGCTQIERYFVLSIVYALLAVNVIVRRQHLKMIDVLYNFLAIGCPPSIMVKCIEFICITYAGNNAILYEFRPTIDRWGYTLLKVDEGLTEDEEEQRELFTQMRKKVYENCLKYAEKFNIKPKTKNNPPKELLDDKIKPYWEKLREKGFIVADGFRLEENVSSYDATYIAEHISGKLNLKNKWKVFEPFWGLHNMAQKLGDIRKGTATPPHQKEINDIFDVKPKNLTKIS